MLPPSRSPLAFPPELLPPVLLFVPLRLSPLLFVPPALLPVPELLLLLLEPGLLAEGFLPVLEVVSPETPPLVPWVLLLAPAWPVVPAAAAARRAASPALLGPPRPLVPFTSDWVVPRVSALLRESLLPPVPLVPGMVEFNPLPRGAALVRGSPSFAGPLGTPEERFSPPALFPPALFPLVLFPLVLAPVPLLARSALGPVPGVAGEEGTTPGRVGSVVRLPS